jgi:hypothetical protein
MESMVGRFLIYFLADRGCAITVISYYAPLVFEQAGWIGRDAILMTGINGLVYVASTVPPYVPLRISTPD